MSDVIDRIQRLRKLKERAAQMEWMASDAERREQEREVQSLVDRPPRAIQWFKLHPRRLEEIPLLPGRSVPPKACALLIDEESTVQQLYQTVRSLGSVYGDKRCRNGISIVFPEDGTTTNSNPAWRGCP